MTTFAAPLFTDPSLRVVDMDSHWTEPADLWTSRAPEKYRKLVPHVKSSAEGDQWFINEDMPFSPIGFTVVGKDGSKAPGINMFTRFDEIDLAATDPTTRLSLNGRLGIWMQILYPNVVGFGSSKFMEIADSDLRLECARIYNDASRDFQSVGKDRLFPMGLVPFWDIPASVQELHRIKGIGLKGIVMCDRPENFGLPHLDSPAWDPFWSTCEELDFPVNFHIGASGSEAIQANMPWPTMKEGSGQRAGVITAVAMFIDNFRVISNMILSGVLERHPKLKIVSVESGFGWIPFLLEALDYQWKEFLVDDAATFSLLPSEYFRRQVYVSFWFEQFGPRKALEFIGDDNVMFETDFPHPTCLYPEMREHITATLRDIPEASRRKILHDNAVKLYHLPE